MRDPGVDLWAQDEVQFQQHGSRCRMWIAPEIADPVVWHEPTRKSVGFFGAVRLRDGKLVYRRENYKFNAESFLEFLKQLKLSACRSGRRVIVLLDNAPYHHGKLHKEWRELHCQQFRLDFLPSYSPELNPIERVWKLTRRKCLHNVHFQQLSELTDAVETQFSLWRNPNQPLRLLCAIT